MVSAGSAAYAALSRRLPAVDADAQLSGDCTHGARARSCILSAWVALAPARRSQRVAVGAEPGCDARPIACFRGGHRGSNVTQWPLRAQMTR